MRVAKKTQIGERLLNLNDMLMHNCEC